MSQQRQQRLVRTWYATDVTSDDLDYIGAFSDPFPAEDATRKIVDVDWSKPGEVMVTWLISA